MIKEKTYTGPFYSADGTESRGAKGFDDPQVSHTLDWVLEQMDKGAKGEGVSPEDLGPPVSDHPAQAKTKRIKSEDGFEVLFAMWYDAKIKKFQLTARSGRELTNQPA